MWIKRLTDGTQIEENRRKGRTWLKTPTENIVEAFLICKGNKSTILSGYNKYWHSRSAISTDHGEFQDIAERIQGLRDDGKWDTVEWDGSKFIFYVANAAIGCPVVKRDER